MPVSIQRRDKLILLVLGIIFFAITLPGISWGTPSIWHPDEQVKVADRALRGLTIIDTRNFDYPSLAKYTMYWLGRVVYGLGYTRADFIQAARLISVLLGSLIVVLTYAIARQSGSRAPSAVFAAGLVISSSEMALNARFAHVDIYLVFFACLSVLLLLKYRSTRKLAWLYGSFITVGLTASSKYNGLSLIVAVILVYIITEKNQVAKNKRGFITPIIVGLVLTFFGFVFGTPRMLLSMSFYVPKVALALLHHATYDIEAGDQIGLLGQWRVLISAHGAVEVFFFLASAIWAIGKVGRFLTAHTQADEGKADQIGVILLSLLALNLPILISYNYPERFFLPFLPLLAVLGGLFIQDFFYLAKQTRYKSLGVVIIAMALAILVLSFLRVASVDLLFINDNRIVASKYLETLPNGASIEYTLYPPNLPERRLNKFNYPIFFQKFPEAEPPQGKAYKFNQGEPGIEKRRPDYFVIDSFTYTRFDDPAVCAEQANECAFFKRLLAGETNYQLMQAFDYQLPDFLPHLQPKFLNPIILVYQRRPGT